MLFRSEVAWLEATGLASPSAALVDTLPEARVLELQARTEFDRFDPMEVVATADEVAALLAKHPDSDYLVFPEDRTRPIKMPDDLPVSWTQTGPAAGFSGEARPGENYWFQLGVWAARRPSWMSNWNALTWSVKQVISPLPQSPASI